MIRVHFHQPMQELTVNFHRSMFTHNALLDEGEMESVALDNNDDIIIIIKFVIVEELIALAIGLPRRGLTLRRIIAGPSNGPIPRFCCCHATHHGKATRRKIHNYRPRRYRPRADDCYKAQRFWKIVDTWRGISASFYIGVSTVTCTSSRMSGSVNAHSTWRYRNDRSPSEPPRPRDVPNERGERARRADIAINIATWLAGTPRDHPRRRDAYS